MSNGGDIAFLALTSVIVIAGGVLAFIFPIFLPEEFTKEASGGTKSLRSRTIEDEPKVYEGSANIEQYNWLTSVSMYRYKDMPESLEFFCAGTILSDDKMLSGDGCYKEHFTKESLYDAVVRSGSAYFWKEGKTHKVSKIIENRSLKEPYKFAIILEVAPNFPSSTIKPKIINAPSVSRRSIKEEGKFIVVGWGGMQDPTEQILKHKPFEVLEWKQEQSASCRHNLCHEADKASSICCNKAMMVNEPVKETGPLSGKVLVNMRAGSPQILALEQIHLFRGKATVEEDLNYFIDIGEPQFMEWIGSIAPTSIVKVNEPVATKRDPVPFYLPMQTMTYIENMEYFQGYNPLEKYIQPDMDY